MEAELLSVDLINDIEGLISYLNKRVSKGIQRGERHKENYHYFVIAKLISESVLEGIISGPKTHDVRFRLIKLAKGWRIKIMKSSGDLLSDLNIVRRETYKLQESALSRKTDFIPNTSNWRGYYMQARSAGPLGQIRFQEAIADGVVSKEFVELAIEWGFTMTRHNH